MVVLKWITCDGETVPEHTYHAGRRENGEALGIARAVMPNGELTAGKFYVAGKSAFIPWGGKEHAAEKFQVLTLESGNLEWDPARDGAVPLDAIVAATNTDGSVTYVGRGTVAAELVPGKVVQSHGVCYVGTAWKEHSLKENEVLVSDESINISEDAPLPGAEHVTITAVLKWVTFEGTVPGYASHAGRRYNGEVLGVARAVMPNGELTGGKFHVKDKNASIPWGGGEHVAEKFQVLSLEFGKLEWEPARDGEVPKAAIVAGTNSDGSRAYVGRGTMAGEVIPGKVVPSHGCCYVCTARKEHSLKAYDVLISSGEVRVSTDSRLPRAWLFSSSARGRYKGIQDCPTGLVRGPSVIFVFLRGILRPDSVSGLPSVGRHWDSFAQWSSSWVVRQQHKEESIFRVGRRILQSLKYSLHTCS